MFQARLLERVEHDPGRREYVRAVTEMSAGGFVTRPTGAQGSGALAFDELMRANSVYCRPGGIGEGLEVGEMAEGAVVGLRALTSLKWPSPSKSPFSRKQEKGT